MRSIFFIATLFLSVSCCLKAQVFFKTEYFGTSSYRITEDERDEKVGNSRGSSIVYQGGINIPLSLQLAEDLRPVLWGMSLGGSYASLDNKNFTEDLVLDEIMNAGISWYHLRPISKKWSVMASVGVGVYAPSTRLSQIRGRHILGSAGSVFIYQFKPNLELGVGVAFNNSFGYPMIFPAFYFKWATDGRIAVNVSMMEGLEISAGYRMNKYLELQLVAEMNGQMAVVEKENTDKLFSHQYIIVGLRPEVKLGKNISIPVTAGFHAMRNAEFSDRSLKGMFQDKGYYFQISPYASAGLKIGF